MERPKKRWGDRGDGYKVRDTTGMANLINDLKPNRCDSEVYINDIVDVTNFVKFMKKQKKDHEGLTYFHGFLDILGKVFYQYPNLNRYIQNRTMFMHYDIRFAFVAKAQFDEISEEFMICQKIEDEDTLYDISDKVGGKINSIRKSKERNNGGGANNAIDILGKLWRPLRSFIVGILKWVDRKFGLPKSLREDNLYYSSAIVSNLGTFKTDGIHHNLTNLGTSSSLITFGEIKEEDGKFFMDIGATLDERISDGFYFCKAVKAMEYLFSHPELMLEPVNKKFDIDEK